ncbi:hypothetical protein LMJF_17_0520 [Leishmania major strain Friedlin]|uniref:Uncharacterized protein n=1 Tax=Leishmania major TaxID=5664 RepID=Q4QEE2_LEIMA|nr:hypothetical protein LMJF_17_0520 [Leishmania major strain Friedlin]CAG9572277.1 hypothetical_protein_-_conserved [Leishmania major strain Friedlin]CAJ03558.1 hypothetical protein LMJF_17_0520 [Leishmania major strain Friedlin]|eukprot:XP_001682306.1 hypothetical protein LMJF_17_0520 [Leishmania major strain Friedlin]
MNVASLPLRRDSDTATTGDGTSLAPPAACSLGLFAPAASTSPQLTQLKSSRRDVEGGVLTRKTSATDELLQCDKVVILRPPPLDDALPSGTAHSTAAVAYVDSSSLPPQHSLSSVAYTTHLAEQPSSASLQSVSDAHAAASRELGRGANINASGSVLTWTLDDTDTTRTSFLQTAGSTQPPSLQASRSSSCQPVVLPVAQQASPSPSPSPATVAETKGAANEPAPATQPRSVLTAEAQRNLQLASASRLSGSGGPVARRCHSALTSLARRSPCAEVKATLRSVVAASGPMDATAGTPARPSYESGRDAGESPLGEASDGCRESRSGAIPTARLTQPPQAVAAARQHSRSDSLLPSTPGRQQQLAVALMPSFTPPHDSTSPSLRTPAPQQTSPCTSAPAVSAPVNVTVSAISDAPDDVPLPQHLDLFTVLPASNTASAGTAGGYSNFGDGDAGGVLRPRLPMPNSANIRGIGTHANSENLCAAYSSVTTSGTETPTQTRTSRLNLGSWNTHHFASSSGWLSSSMKNTDGGSGGLVVGSRWNDGSCTSTPPPTNSELFRQIRQSTTHVKSILRKSGSSTEIAYGATVLNDGDQANKNRSCVLLPSVHGGGVGGRAETTACTTPRITASSGMAGGGNGRTSAMSSPIDEPALQMDFIVLRHTTSDADRVNGSAKPADASPSPTGSRSRTHRGFPTGTWPQPNPDNINSVANSNVSGVLGTSVENGKGVFADGVHGSGNAGTGSTPLSSAVQRSLAFPCQLSRSPSTPGHPSPHRTQQCRSSGMRHGGGANIGNTSNGETQVLPPPSTATELPILFARDTVAAARCTSDEPPPEIILASPSPKRVRVVV